MFWPKTSVIGFIISAVHHNFDISYTPSHFTLCCWKLNLINNLHIPWLLLVTDSLGGLGFLFVVATLGVLGSVDGGVEAPFVDGAFGGLVEIAFVNGAFDVPTVVPLVDITVVDGTVDALVDGTVDAFVDGTVVALVDGTVDAFVDGTVVALVDGTVDASVDGSVDAFVDGTVDASVDGSVDAFVDGTVDALVDGTVDAFVDGTVDASVDGIVDAFVDGTLDVFWVDGTFDGTEEDETPTTDGGGDATVVELANVDSFTLVPLSKLVLFDGLALVLKCAVTLFEGSDEVKFRFVGVVVFEDTLALLVLLLLAVGICVVETLLGLATEREWFNIWLWFAVTFTW